MAARTSRQLTLKPQDLLVLMALVVRPSGVQATYAELAEQTGLAASAVHAAVKRAVAAGLARFQQKLPIVLKPQLREFLTHGAKYAFPAVHGGVARGIPTAYAAPPLNAAVADSSDPPPVWAHPKGSLRGVALAPLYPTAPDAALRDKKLYELLALFDGLRSGQARERNLAQRLLEERMQ